MGQPENPRF